jgi:ABC-2 type transport system ATP-binding protein
MSEQSAIQFESLSKQFGKGDNAVEAVKGVSLQIQAGQVYGFLGPNGAGKTTTIRLIMDLIRPTGGQVLIFGENVNKNPRILKRVGALVEGASFYGYLNGHDNLLVLQRTANENAPKRVEALLDQVGLADKSHRQVKDYSTGMKQRLGIAAALLGNPDLVILDEPTNGLDPAGMQEMRNFIRTLVEQQGKTVFLSSHLLNEVEQICDQVAIIHNGEILRRGEVKDLLAREQSEFRLQVRPVRRALEILSERWEVTIDESWLVLQTRSDENPTIIALLAEHRIQIYQAIMHRQSLEDYFLDVTQADPAEALLLTRFDAEERDNG